LSKGIDPVGSRPLYRQREGGPSGYRRPPVPRVREGVIIVVSVRADVTDAIAFADCTFPDVLEPPGLEVARHCH
jgi:hypothetical protein